MVAEGADIIDVGGESTRPFSDPTSPADEMERVLPVIRGIKARSNVFISIDTYRSETAEKAIEAGADIVNDISGLTFDPQMAALVAATGVQTVVMHIKGVPGDMQANPYYDDVVGEIKDFLSDRIQYAREHGVAEDKIIVDPGIGFGKRVEDNLRILKDLSSFKELGRPVLIGTSMKSFIGKVTGSTLEGRLAGTLATVAVALWNGADIVRVHDVEKTVQVMKMVEAIKNV